MKPPPFEYHVPASLDEALSLLAVFGEDARPLAGGQSLIPVLNFRLSRPGVLVDLNRLAELSGIAERDGAIHIGAMTRQRHVEQSALIAEHAPLLAEAMPHIAHPQIRNRGTIGGSLAHADPSAELPAVALAMEARFRIRGPSGERVLPANEFYTGLFSTALAVGELLVEIDFPVRPPGSGWAFEEVARRHGDFALLGVAAGVIVDAEGVCRAARLAFVNAGPGPLRARVAEAALVGARPDVGTIRAAAALAASDDVRPGSDVHASAAYRTHLARVLSARALTRAFGRAALHPAS